MGLSPRPDAASSCRSGIQTRAYLNGTYPYLPATLVPTDYLHPHSYTVDEGIHSINRLPKFPSTKLSQCQYDNRHQSRYPYTPAIQPQVHVSEHNRNAQTFPSHLDRRNRQVPNHSHSASINAAPASSCSPAKRGVAMVFVPEQPAKRAMMFEPSLFQRNDPSAAPQETHGRVPLSELNIPTALLDRYTHTKSLRASAAGPPRRPYVDLIPPSAPPLVISCTTSRVLQDEVRSSFS
ncbi:hypothetical protein OPQ81_002894 [Rhizoctonia solani]|nr:hypothetical protein OPQ81_002894 [Rhizoctonia solani]